MTLLLSNDWYAYGVFDLDGNILKTSTKVHVRDRVTKEDKQIEWWRFDEDPSLLDPKSWQFEIPNWNFELAYQNYRDVTLIDWHKWFDGLQHDIAEAIEKKEFWKSISDLRKTFLIPWRIWAILTARWNGSDNLEVAAMMLNDSLLNEAEKEEQFENIIKNYNLTFREKERVLSYYFKEVVAYVGCDNKHNRRMLWLNLESGAMRKAQAMKNYLIPQAEELIQKAGGVISQQNPLRTGFSDDSFSNITHMREALVTKVGPSNQFRLYYTWESDTEKALSLPWAKLAKRWDFDVVKIPLG